MTDIPTKRCSTCKLGKPLDAFCKDRGTKDGLNHRCKACVKLIRSTPHYKALAQKRQLERYHTEPEFRAMKIASSKTCQDAKPDHGIGRFKAWMAQQPPEWEAQAKAQWVQDHPEERSASSRRYTLRLANVPVNDLTKEQWIALQIAFAHRCAYCGKRAKGHLTKDHITPVTKGGSTTLSNIVPACRSCNGKKRDGAPLIPVQPFFLL